MKIPMECCLRTGSAFLQSVTFILLSLLVSAHEGFCQQMKPFSILPFDKVSDYSKPGRDYHLQMHRTKLEFSVKITTFDKINPKWTGSGSLYSPEIAIDLTDFNLSSVRQKDPQHRYFMAFGQVNGFFRLRSYNVNFSEEGFMLGGGATYEDQTIQVLVETAKTVATVVMFAPKDDTEKIEDYRKKAEEATRLQQYAEKLTAGQKRLQLNNAEIISGATIDHAQLERVTKALSAIEMELLAVKKTRSDLLLQALKTAVVKVAIYMPDVTEQEFAGVSNPDAKGKVTKQIGWGDDNIQWKQYKDRFQAEFGAEAVNDLVKKLPTKIEYEVESVYPIQNQGFNPFGRDSTHPAKGIVYRCPVKAGASLLGTAGNPDALVFKTAGYPLKFGQLGQLMFLPYKESFLSKGTLSIEFNPDGEVVKASSGNGAATGASLNTALASGVTGYQAIKKLEAAGGLETELTNAESARIKARIDLINNRKALEALSTQE